MGDPEVSRPQTDESLRLIVKIGCLAHSFGVSSSRLEADLNRLAKATGHEGVFQVTPSSIVFVLWHKNRERQSIHVESLPGSAFNLGKLAGLSEIINKGINNQISMSECLDELKELKTASNTWGQAIVAMGYALCGAGFAVMMSLGIHGVIVAALVSLCIYVLGRCTQVWPALGPRFEILSGCIVGVLVVLASVLAPGGTPTPTIIAGLVILLPGYGLTLGSGELASGHISSGMQRLMSATLTALKLFVGAGTGVMGVSLMAELPEPIPAKSLGIWANWLAVSALIFGLAFVFQVRRSEILWVLFIGLVTYLGMVTGSHLGSWQGSFCGAFVLGITAILSSKRLDRHATIALVPGLMILVPGASAVLGIQEAVVEGATAGLAAEVQTLQNIGAILAGLVTARNLVSNERPAQ